MIRSFLSALTLLTLATPASAGTWVTYLERTDNDSVHRTYQIDVQSIASHQGWIHSNMRICHDYGRDCKDTIFTASAHCKDKKLREINTVTHTLRNNTEWWTSFDNRHGTRYKFVKPGHLEEYMASTKRRDNDKTLLFNFLCDGTKG
jgi:hypothetical protein